MQESKILVSKNNTEIEKVQNLFWLFKVLDGDDLKENLCFVNIKSDITT